MQNIIGYVVKRGDFLEGSNFTIYFVDMMYKVFRRPQNLMQKKADLVKFVRSVKNG